MLVLKLIGAVVGVVILLAFGMALVVVMQTIAAKFRK